MRPKQVYKILLRDGWWGWGWWWNKIKLLYVTDLQLLLPYEVCIYVNLLPCTKKLQRCNGGFCTSHKLTILKG